MSAMSDRQTRLDRQQPPEDPTRTPPPPPAHGVLTGADQVFLFDEAPPVRLPRCRAPQPA